MLKSETLKVIILREITEEDAGFNAFQRIVENLTPSAGT
jgi:DNA-binding HxlR family transcriptional regulator